NAMAHHKQKKYWEMTLEQLREATKEFDKPLPPSKLSPLSPDLRRRWEKSRRQGVRSIFLKPKRPKTVKLKLDEELINQSENYASQHNMTLSEVVERSLRSVLTFVR